MELLASEHILLENVNTSGNAIDITKSVISDG
jgi:hypothetical protein